MTIAEIFERYGYDREDPVSHLEFPELLLEDLGLAQDDEEMA